ncbi:P-loop containing nucleoside triphosphate hydrolase protein [Fimicolochytrium jonesii]|uniref:P-loop containing nucleoside triphosphate hydrolase protein n=1 Tax=Fimicolochytrium jonesii TaxID=1396493 RepID=UPI0022FE2C48|nr:P-loop containing nucleoside triphosphate hydrolase protein [Fimicolochytrium jonesii]KAI8824956.1 P-loop containing nucleoside triphosphate hydrolase protein [Fimicolochytrium jonesii]
MSDGWDAAEPVSNGTEKHNVNSDAVPMNDGDGGWGTDVTNGADAAAQTAPAAETRKHKFGVREEIVVPDAENVVWLANAERWEEGVRNVNLETRLYRDNIVHAGEHFEDIRGVHVTTVGEEIPDKLESFEQLNIPTPLRENILSHMRYSKPTPVQAAAIPVLLSGRDVMATAQTGSGKTCAYMLPIMIKMLERGNPRASVANAEAAGGEEKQSFFSAGAGAGPVEPQALIVVPTRELASQIHHEARKFAYLTWVKPSVIYGGAGTRNLIDEMRKGTDILIATPGKLLDLLEKGVILLRKIKFLVIDEADRLFELGFAEDVMRICKGFDLPQDESKRVCLFSATFPKSVRAFAGQLLGDCALITVGQVGVVPTDIKQEVLELQDNEKTAKLLDILFESEVGLTLIFVNTCRAADTLDDSLYRLGFPVTSIHSGRSQAERESSISAFRANKIPLMIATDIAARGWDIPNIVQVINYDMPKDIDDYIHRIGRTARVGNVGTATSFFNPEKNDELGPALVKVLKEAGQPIPEFLQRHIEEMEIDGAEGPDNLKEEDLEGEVPDFAAAGGSNGADGGEGGWDEGEGGGWATGGDGDGGDNAEAPAEDASGW